MLTDRASRIQSMFSRIATRYDLMNRLMTFGRDQAWRVLAARELQLPTHGLCFDLATGTGDFASAVREVYPTARVVGMDFALTMMQVAQQKLRGEDRISFASGDAHVLPFVDGQFDGLTNGFLLRNVVDLPRALGEMKRIVKKGGRVVCLEITHPQTPIFRQLFQIYFYRFVPLLGGIVAGDLNAYTYLPNSLTLFPAAEPLRALMLQVGYRYVYYRLLMLGTMAIHVGVV
jgi:demethylmenaquinone methyltransferase/2-methoxy-6-polyprenyl-1,4-benzoquinol methylase